MAGVCKDLAPVSGTPANRYDGTQKVQDFLQIIKRKQVEFEKKTDKDVKAMELLIEDGKGKLYRVKSCLKKRESRHGGYLGALLSALNMLHQQKSLLEMSKLLEATAAGVVLKSTFFHKSEEQVMEDFVQPCLWLVAFTRALGRLSSSPLFWTENYTDAAYKTHTRSRMLALVKEKYKVDPAEIADILRSHALGLYGIIEMIRRTSCIHFRLPTPSTLLPRELISVLCFPSRDWPFHFMLHGEFHADPEAHFVADPPFIEVSSDDEIEEIDL